MAASRSARQLAEVGAFVQALYELGGYSTWKEFADDARISAPQVSDFKNGSAEPSGYNLLRLIQVAAARAGEDAVAVSTRSVGLQPDISAGVASLLLGQAEILDRLDEVRQREQREQKPVAPRKKADGRKTR